MLCKLDIIKSQSFEIHCFAILGGDPGGAPNLLSDKIFILYN